MLHFRFSLSENNLRKKNVEYELYSLFLKRVVFLIRPTYQGSKVKIRWCVLRILLKSLQLGQKQALFAWLGLALCPVVSEVENRT